MTDGQSVILSWCETIDIDIYFRIQLIQLQIANIHKSLDIYIDRVTCQITETSQDTQ
jgi:hypothetical protein